jgi:hypothetical protein
VSECDQGTSYRWPGPATGGETMRKNIGICLDNNHERITQSDVFGLYFYVRLFRAAGHCIKNHRSTVSSRSYFGIRQYSSPFSDREF